MKNKLLLGLFSSAVGFSCLLQGVFLDLQSYLFYFAAFAAFIAVMAFMINNKRKIQFYHPLDYALPVFIIVYIISTFFAVSAKLNVLEIIKYIGYLLIFIIVRYLAADKENIKKLLQIIFIITAMVGITGIGGAMNIIPYKGSYLQSENLINGPMLNNNVFGIVCLLGVLIGYGLYQYSKTNWERFIYSIGGFILIMGAANAFSISAWVVFAVLLAVFIALTWQYKIENISYSLILILPLTLCYNQFASAMQVRDFWGMILIMIAGLISAALLSTAIEFLNMVSRNIKKKIVYIEVAAIFCTLALFFIIPSALLPDKALEQISIQAAAEVKAKTTAFYADSFKAITENPIIGSGGNAWDVIYHTYQSSSDVSNQELSYIMKVWLEVGTIGLLVFVITLAILIYSAFIAVKKHNPLGATSSCGAFLLLFHSFIDLTFNISSILILFWIFAAIIASMSIGGRFKLKLNTSPYYALFLSLLGFITAFMFYIGTKYSLAGNEALSRKDYLAAAPVFKKAIKWNPLDDESRLSYIYSKLFALSQGGEQETGFVDEFNQTLENVLKRGYRNVPIVAAGQVLYNFTSQTMESVVTAEHLIEIQPLVADNYEVFARSYAEHANKLIKQGDKEGAKTFLNYIIETPSVLDRLTNDKKEKVNLTVDTLLIIKSAKEVLNELNQ